MNPQHQSQEAEDGHLEKNINNPPVNTNDHKKNLQQLAEYQGDHIDKKRNNVFRIGLININGIPKSAEDPKIRTLKNILQCTNMTLWRLQKSIVTSQ